MTRTCVGAVIIALLFCGTLWAGGDECLYQSGIHKMEVEGKLDEAIAIFQKVVESSKEKTPSLAAKALWQIATCYEKQGKKNEQTKALQQIVDQFPKEEALVKSAKEKMGKTAHPLVGTWKGSMEIKESKETLNAKLRIILEKADATISGIVYIDIPGEKPVSFPIQKGSASNSTITIECDASQWGKGATMRLTGEQTGDVIDGIYAVNEDGKEDSGTWRATRMTKESSRKNDDITECVELLGRIFRLAKEKNYRELGMLLADGRKPVSSKLDKFLKSAENPNRNDDVPRTLSQVETLDTLLQKGKIEIKIEEAKTTSDTVVIPYTGEKISGVVKKAEASREDTSNDEYLCFVKIDGKWLWVPFGW